MPCYLITQTKSAGRSAPAIVSRLIGPFHIRRNTGKRLRPEEAEVPGFSAPAQRPDQQRRAENGEPQANRVHTESQMSYVSETGGHESASAPRRRTGHEEITDMAYEAADHTQDFAAEIEDAVRPLATHLMVRHPHSIFLFSGQDDCHLTAMDLQSCIALSMHGWSLLLR